jgi:tRNA-binding protein
LRSLTSMSAAITDFEKIDIRAGKIVEVNDYPEARKPSYLIKIDFGDELGIKQSIGQFVANYSRDQLINKLVAAVINFEPRKIGSESSEVLTLGFPDTNGNAVLVSPSQDVPLGGRLF